MHRNYTVVIIKCAKVHQLRNLIVILQDNTFKRRTKVLCPKFVGIVDTTSIKFPSLLYVTLLALAIVVAILLFIPVIRIIIKRIPSIPTVILRLSLQAKFKVCASFYQVVSSLQVVYGVQFDEDLKTIFNLFNKFNFDVFYFISLP